jgi:hypothetical protein
MVKQWDQTIKQSFKIVEAKNRISLPDMKNPSIRTLARSLRAGDAGLLSLVDARVLRAASNGRNSRFSASLSRYVSK